MQSPLYHLVATYVDDAFTSAGNPRAPKHLERTVHWVKVLKPDADETLLIAARAHDVERAFQKDRPANVVAAAKNGFTDPVYLTFHQTKGADLIAKFLQHHGANPELIARVHHLIIHHEDGGDDDQNILQDADSISFFIDNVDYFIKNYIPKRGTEAVRQKFRFMWSRMNTEKAKKLIKPWYDKAMARLDEA